MTDLANWSDLLFSTATRDGGRCALVKGQVRLTYEQVAARVEQCAAGLAALGLRPGERLAVYLPKTIETVIVFCAAAQAGLVVVPVNPALKSDQVRHILNDCAVSCLLSQDARLAALSGVLAETPSLRAVISIDGGAYIDFGALSGERVETLGGGEDLAFILYTSGSTGKPKGVMVTHNNILAGAGVVSGYLNVIQDDCILALLPFSFDYGLNQLMMGLMVGAQIVLHDYFLPGDVVRVIERHGVTALACVPPLWHQLMGAAWTDAAISSLRIMTNSGGRMPQALLFDMRRVFPQARIFLMYGLTEAFRSTYLDPDELDTRPQSIGKAVPGEEILVVRPDGSLCDVDEVGELVHVGRLVAKGYWGDEDRTRLRFRPAPKASRQAREGEMAVWSGDKVHCDSDGFLYFVGRDDEMIKTSGYRVSPTEVEEALMSLPQIAQAVAFGQKDEVLGEAIIAVVTARDGAVLEDTQVLSGLRAKLPAYMVPQCLIWRSDLPMGPNGKIDRTKVRDAAMEEIP